MIKIRIKESDSAITIPMPYFAIKSFLIKANEATNNKEENNEISNEVIKVLKTFAKKNPGFVFVDIHDKEGTEVKITL